MGRELWQIPKNERRLKKQKPQKKATASNSLAGRCQMVLRGAELPAARNCDLVQKKTRNKNPTEGSSENSTSEKYFVVL